MLHTFLSTLSPMATLFLSMSVGYILKRFNILPNESGKVISKLIMWALYPALCFVTMAKYCTPSTLAKHGSNIIFSSIGILIALSLSASLVNVFAKRGTYERGVYRYALTFSNCGYMGDPLVLALFGDLMLSYYKIYCLPINIIIYTWGFCQLVPSTDKSFNGIVKKFFNPPTTAMLLGTVVGLSGLGEYLPAFMTGTLESLKACMGPMAMILAGFTVANYNILSMLKNKKTYLATALRLLVLPTVIICILYFSKELYCLVTGIQLDNLFLYLAFFATATPLGLNTVVIPESYGQDPEPGAGMTLISHTLCIITIPLMFSFLTMIFGYPSL